MVRRAHTPDSDLGLPAAVQTSCHCCAALQQPGGGLVQQIVAAGPSHQHAQKGPTSSDTMPASATAADPPGDGVSAAPSQLTAQQTSQRPSLKARRQQSAARAAQHRLQTPRRAHTVTAPSAMAPVPSNALPDATRDEEVQAANGEPEHSPAAAEPQATGSVNPPEPGALLGPDSVAHCCS